MRCELGTNRSYGRSYFAGLYQKIGSRLAPSLGQAPGGPRTPDAVVLNSALHHDFVGLGACAEGSERYGRLLAWWFTEVRASGFAGPLVWRSCAMTHFSDDPVRGAVGAPAADGPPGARVIARHWVCRSRDNLLRLHRVALSVARRHKLLLLDAMSISDAMPEATWDNRHFSGMHPSAVLARTRSAPLHMPPTLPSRELALRDASQQCLHVPRHRRPSPPPPPACSRRRAADREEGGDTSREQHHSQRAAEPPKPTGSGGRDGKRGAGGRAQWIAAERAGGAPAAAGYGREFWVKERV